MEKDNKENGFVTIKDASLLSVFMCSATCSIWGYLLIILSMFFLVFFETPLPITIIQTSIGVAGVLFSMWLKNNAKYCSSIHTKRLLDKLDKEGLD